MGLTSDYFFRPEVFLGTSNHLILLPKAASLTYNSYIEAKSLMERCSLQLWVLPQSLGAFKNKLRIFFSTLVIWTLWVSAQFINIINLQWICMSHVLNTLLHTGAPAQEDFVCCKCMRKLSIYFWYFSPPTPPSRQHLPPDQIPFLLFPVSTFPVPLKNGPILSLFSPSPC